MPNNKTLENMLCAYPDWEATLLINILITCPNTGIHTSNLEKCITQNITPSEAEKENRDCSPIQMTDQQTLREIDVRLNHLLHQKAESACAAYDAEINALTLYRRECTTPFGKIKCFADDDDKAYHRQYSAINRLLKKAAADGHHEAVAIVKQCLRKGRQMMWQTL